MTTESSHSHDAFVFDGRARMAETSKPATKRALDGAAE
jgi:hypothetical protein